MQPPLLACSHNMFMPRLRTAYSQCTSQADRIKLVAELRYGHTKRQAAAAAETLSGFYLGGGGGKGRPGYVPPPLKVHVPPPEKSKKKN